MPALVRFGAGLGITPGTVRANVTEAATSIAQFLASGAVAAGQNAVRAFGQFFLMLYVLFFFLRDGDQLLLVIARALPLGDARERALFERFTAVTRATLKGTLVVGAVQGTLGAIFFALLGLEGPVFWGAMMWACSLIPVIGPTIIWLPTAIFLLLTGAIAKGLLLLGLGTFVIALADNIIRPILVGRETRMPDFLVLLSTLGGLTLFGLSGFVAGPAIAALFITAWDMFAREYATSDRDSETGSSSPKPEARSPKPVGPRSRRPTVEFRCKTGMRFLPSLLRLDRVRAGAARARSPDLPDNEDDHDPVSTGWIRHGRCL